MEGLPRARISAVRRATIFQRSGGRCEHGCGREITLDTFHVAHLRSHANGGPETDENLQAWCTRCNYEQGATDAADTRTPPREWQLEALDPVVARIKADPTRGDAYSEATGSVVVSNVVRRRS